MSEWQPGDVALCVDDRIPFPNFAYAKQWLLRRGDLYTVTGTVIEAFPTPYDMGVEKLCLRFLEVVNPSPIATGFDARRFIKQPSLVIECEEKHEEPVE